MKTAEDDKAKTKRLMKKRKEVAARRERWKKRGEEILKELKEEFEAITESLKERKKELAAAMEERKTEEIAAMTEEIADITKNLEERKEEIEEITKKLEESKKEETSTSLSLEMWSCDDNDMKFMVKDICVLESEMIYTLMLLDESHIHHTDIESQILHRVLTFCADRASYKALSKYMGEAFDSNYLEQLSRESCRYLAKLLRAACELEVKSLAKMTSIALVTMVGEKDTQEILKIFNYTGKITSKEMGNAMKLQPWARDLAPRSTAVDKIEEGVRLPVEQKIRLR